MKYLIDTNICIYFLNNVPVIVDKLKNIPSEEIAISLITNNTRHFSNMAGISLENWITG